MKMIAAERLYFFANFVVGAAENVEKSAKIAVAKWGVVWYNGGAR